MIITFQQFERVILPGTPSHFESEFAGVEANRCCQEEVVGEVFVLESSKVRTGV